MGRKKNSFSKALGHLKSTKIDEKLEVLNEIPTNNTTTLYTVVPGSNIRVDNLGKVPDHSSIDWDIDGSNGQDTTGLFDGAGNHKFISPPGDNSYILGPMSSMYYTYASPSTWTRIGYIRASDRRMVNLGTIDGTLEDWDGTSTNFSSYGQLTLEQAQWFKNTAKKDGGYRAFYPGPPSSTPDAFGRYYCTITGTPIAKTDDLRDRAPIDQQPEDVFAAIMDRIRQGKKLSKQEEQFLRDHGMGDFLDEYSGKGNVAYDAVSELIGLGVAFVAVKALLPTILAAGKGALKYVKDWYNTGRNISVPNEGTAAWRNLIQNDLKQVGKFSGGKGKWYPRNAAELREIFTGKGGLIWSFTRGFKTAPTPAFRQAVERLFKTAFGGGKGLWKWDYEPQGELISESRRNRILKTLKDPVVIPETKQKSYKVDPGRRYKKDKTNFQGMEKLVGDTKPQESFKEPQDLWSDGWQGHNARVSQDKKNIVLEKIGEGKQAWNYMLNHGTVMNAKQLEEFWGKNPDFYSYFFGGKKYRPTRKEQVKGDYIVFLVDEAGKTTSMLQSELNIKLSEESDNEMLSEYTKIDPISYEKDPLFKKVSKVLKSKIDYPEKPAKKGYPNEPPPKLGPDGFHPDFGKKYKYDKLDPVSAIAMKNAPTGNPEIDANVEKAAKKSK